jgi:4-amino-4-deoxy-L-arabinose transferase-like glycosyltransferase
VAKQRWIMSTHRNSRQRFFIVLTLSVVGQAIVQAIGRLIPSMVRYPGPWAPTLMEDSGVYIRQAENLPQLQPEFVTKSVYIALLRFDEMLGASGWLIVSIQFAMLVAAGYALAQFVGDRWGDRAGVLAAAFFVLNPQVTQWTKTIFMDPLFMPLIVMLTLLLARTVEGESTRLSLAIVGIIALFLRPNGLGAVLGVAGLLILRSKRLRFAKAGVGLAFVVAVLLVSPAFETPGGVENTLAARTYEGLVVWVAPDHVRIDMPAATDPSDFSNSALARYALQHPVSMMRLGLLRVGWEFIQIRSHYPPVLNGIIGLQMFGVFILAMVGFRGAHGSALNASVVAVSLGLMLIVAGTWAIAEGRFGWAMFATWSPWLGLGADRLMSKVWKGRRSGVRRALGSS